MHDTPFRSASELVRDIASRRISSRELLELYLARVDRFNPAINAVIVEQREHARARADAVDAALARGESCGSLCGLPIGVQIIGPMMGDLQTIQLAQFLERQGFAFTPPPACP